MKASMPISVILIPVIRSASMTSVLLPLMLVVGVLVTHRVAGPIYRFEQHLGAIARGEDPGVCRIRKTDELHDLCRIINEAVDAMKTQADGSEATGAEQHSESKAA